MRGEKMKRVEVVKMGGVGASGPGSVYIGRGSEFGNQFKIGVDGTRAEVVEKYRGWFLEKMREPAFRRSIWELEGKRLVCFCAPRACHGDVIKEWLEMGEDGEGEE